MVVSWNKYQKSSVGCGWQEEGGWIIHQIILISGPRTSSSISPSYPNYLPLSSSTSQPIDLMIGLYLRKRFSPRSSLAASDVSDGDLEDSNKLDVKRRKLAN